MKKHYKKLLVVVGLWVLFFSGQAMAALQVNFAATPLFNEASIVPGDSVSRTVVVTNTGTSSRQVQVAVANTATDGLANAMTLTVTAPSQSYYSGSLSEFFAVTPLSLGTLAPGATVTYTFTAALPSLAGNEVELKNARFDLLMGAWGEPLVSDNPVLVGNPGSGGGSGGGALSPKLNLFNETVVDINPATGAATVTWNSNLQASSYLVCSLKSSNPTLSSTAPLFGYQFAVSEVDLNTISHALVVTNLDTSQGYECRPAGRVSLEGAMTVGQPVLIAFPGGQVAGITAVGGDFPLAGINNLTPNWLEPVGAVLGEQVSKLPLGGLALGAGQAIADNFLILLLALLFGLLSLYLFLRRRVKQR